MRWIASIPLVATLAAGPADAGLIDSAKDLVAKVFSHNHNAEIRNRIIYGSQADHYARAQEAERNGNFSEASYQFALSVVNQNPDSPHFWEAADQINMFGKDKLFAEQSQKFQKKMEIQYSAADALLSYAKSLPAGSLQRKQAITIGVQQLREIIAEWDSMKQGLATRGNRK